MQMVMFTKEKERKRFFVRDVSIRRVLLNEGSPTCIHLMQTLSVQLNKAPINRRKFPGNE